MKDRIKGCLAFIFALLIVVGLLALAYFFSVKIWQYFSGLQKEVAVAIVAGAATITVSVITVVVGKYYERKRAIEQELREKKMPMYCEFVEFWFSVMHRNKSDDVSPEERERQSIEFFKSFTQRLMVWGSDEVVGEWSRLRRSWAKTQEFSPQALLEFERLLLAIRRDTGHTNAKLKQGDLLGLFINDIDDALPTSGAAGRTPVAASDSGKAIGTNPAK